MRISDWSSDVCSSYLFPPHAPCHLAVDPPVGPCFSGAGKDRTLATDPPLRIGDRAVLFSPCRSRKGDMRISERVGPGHAVGHHPEWAGGQRFAHRAGFGHPFARVCRLFPHRLFLSYPLFSLLYSIHLCSSPISSSSFFYFFFFFFFFLFFFSLFFLF